MRTLQGKLDEAYREIARMTGDMEEMHIADQFTQQIVLSHQSAATILSNKPSLVDAEQ